MCKIDIQKIHIKKFMTKWKFLLLLLVSLILPVIFIRLVVGY